MSLPSEAARAQKDRVFPSSPRTGAKLGSSWLAPVLTMLSGTAGKPGSAACEPELPLSKPNTVAEGGRGHWAGTKQVGGVLGEMSKGRSKQEGRKATGGPYPPRGRGENSLWLNV